MTKEREEIRQRVMGAVLRRAIFSWQVGVTVLFTLLLFGLAPQPFDFWQNWFWLIGGAIAAGGFVLSTVNDPQAVQEVVAAQFENQYDLSEIKNRVSRQRIEEAMEYRRNMMTLGQRAKGTLRMSLTQTVDDVNKWIEHMYSLAKHIDSFEANELVTRDRKMVPQQLEKARARMEREQAPEVRRELERQVHQLEQQLANLNATVNGVRRAEIQLETTLSSLATIYAQMARLGAKEVDSGRAQRLRLEIQDEISGLQDTIDAMDEVQAQTMSMG